jgi:hypothetical protein
MHDFFADQFVALVHLGNSPAFFGVALLAVASHVGNPMALTWPGLPCPRVRF